MLVSLFYNVAFFNPTQGRIHSYQSVILANIWNGWNNLGNKVAIAAKFHLDTNI